MPPGTKCGDHPSKDALAYCEECGKPICGDCAVHFGGCCSSCVATKFNLHVKELTDMRSTGKTQLTVDIVFSVIGLIIGISIMAANPNLWFLAWMFLGIGGNFRMALAKLPEKYRIVRDGEGSLLKALAGTLFVAILALLIKSLAGPIIPVIKMLACRREMKVCDAMVVVLTELNRRQGVYSAYAKYIDEEHGVGGNLSKLTAAGGALADNEYAKVLVNGEDVALHWMCLEGVARDKGVTEELVAWQKAMKQEK